MTRDLHMHLPQTIEHLATDALTPYARNSRTHSAQQIEQLAASMLEFGFTNPVLIDEHDTIIAGHGRVMAALQLGLSRVPCIRLAHLTSAQRRAYVIADNKLAEQAGWDAATLARELEDLAAEAFNLELLGFSDEQLDGLLGPAANDKRSDPDVVPPVRAMDVVSVPGDVWLLGQHKVICGSSTDHAVWTRLMGPERADVCWTDPPYNVAYDGVQAGSIMNDDLPDDAFRALLNDAFRAVAGVMKPGAAIYVAHADSEGMPFRSAFVGAGFKLAGCLIWRKNNMVLGRSDYQWQHEPILYGWKKGGAHRWYGGRKQTTLHDWGGVDPVTQLPDGRYQIEVGDRIFTLRGDVEIEELMPSVFFEPKPQSSADHPTMKPVNLIARHLRNNARSGAIVVDGFGGSGSTLIAADRLGMRARLVELDPKFCDVIVRRWQEYSGGTARHESSGESFAQRSRSLETTAG